MLLDEFDALELPLLIDEFDVLELPLLLDDFDELELLLLLELLDELELLLPKLCVGKSSIENPNTAAVVYFCMVAIPSSFPVVDCFNLIFSKRIRGVNFFLPVGLVLTIYIAKVNQQTFALIDPFIGAERACPK